MEDFSFELFLELDKFSLDILVMSDNSETKQIILTGDAAQSMSGGKKRRSRKNNQSAGGSTQSGTIVQLQSTSSSSDNSTAAVTGVNNSKLAQVSSAPIQNAGGKVKVILNQPRKKTKRQSKKLMAI